MRVCLTSLKERVEELGAMTQISSALRLAFHTRRDVFHDQRGQLTSLLKADSTIFVTFDPSKKRL